MILVTGENYEYKTNADDNNKAQLTRRKIGLLGNKKFDRL